MARFTFKTAQQETTWPALRDFWREADQAAVFEGGWLFDHFYPIYTDHTGPCLEGWTTLAGLASITTRLRLGLMVASNTYRHPAVHANMIATIDHISDGRLEFGFGAGWFEMEHDAYGIELPPLKERFDRFDEAVEIILSLLTNESTTFRGDHYRLENALLEPKPVQRPHPPLVIGGKGEKRTLRTAARFANHWNYPGWGDVAEFRHKSEVLDMWCAEYGRDPADIERSIQFRPDESTPGALVETVGQALEAGVDHVVVYFAPPHDPAAIAPVAEAIAQLG